MNRRRLLALAGCNSLLLGAGLRSPALAQGSFPNRTITLVVPFAPGGGTDAIARTLGKGLATDLNGTVIIENKPGGGTVIGSDQVARAAPDGHTLVLATIAHAVNPTINPNIPYDTEKAFAPIGLIATSFNVLVVKPTSAIRSVADLISAAKGAPGKLTYASQGIGTSAHLAGELFQAFAKVTMTHVPYRGAGPAVSDLLGGHVDMMFATNAAVSSHIEAGSLRAIAITAPPGRSSLPGVPTFADSGLPDVVLNNWYGLLAPAGTPPAIVERLNAAAMAASKDPEFQKVGQTEGLSIRVSSPAELGSFISADIARWRTLLAQNPLSRN